MPKTTPTRTATLNMRVGPKMKETIKGYAKAREMNMGEFVLYAIWTYMDQTPMDPDEDLKSAKEQLGDPESWGGKAIELGEVRRG